MSVIIFEYSTWITYGDFQWQIQFHSERRNDEVWKDRLDTDNKDGENDRSDARKWTSMVVITGDEEKERERPGREKTSSRCTADNWDLLIALTSPTERNHTKCSFPIASRSLSPSTDCFEVRSLSVINKSFDGLSLTRLLMGETE